MKKFKGKTLILTYSYVLALLFVLQGSYFIAAQVYFVRELLVVFCGNELCFGIIFFCWFPRVEENILQTRNKR